VAEWFYGSEAGVKTRRRGRVGPHPRPPGRDRAAVGGVVGAATPPPGGATNRAEN